MINKLSSILLFTFCLSCNNNDSIKQKEVELKQQELELKAKQLQFDSANLQKSITKSNNESIIENLIGYWFTPHAATQNIRFYRDNTFKLNDYNLTLEKEELLTGTFELSGSSLTLFYTDRPKQKFIFYKGEGNDDNYYIKNPRNYFVKGEDGDQ